MPSNFFQPEYLGSEFEELAQDLRLGTPTAVFGVSAPFKGLLAASCVSERMVYIADNAQTAARMASEIAGFAGEEVVLLNAKDEVLLYKDAVSKDALYRRLEAMWRIQNGARRIVCDIESLVQLFPKRLRFLRLEEGKDIDFMGLAAELVSLGYTRTAAVENKGQFALRGDILDIFPVGSENPARVDFFGDTVEKIKPYNFLTGERLAQTSILNIVAASDVEIGQDEVKKIRDCLFGELNSFKDAAAYNRAQTIAGELSAKLESGGLFGGASYLLPLLKNSVDFRTFFGNVLYIFDECKLIADKADALYKEHEERYCGLRRGGEVFSFCKDQYIDRERLEEALHSASAAALSALPVSRRV